MTTTRPPRILHYAAEICRRSARRGHPVGTARAERIGRRYLRMAKSAGIQPMYVPSAAERDAENGARLLKEYDNSLRAANQRIAELERERDEYQAEANRLLKLIAERDYANDDLRVEIARRGKQITGLGNALAERENDLDLANAHAERLMKERDKAQTIIAELKSALDKTLTPDERNTQVQAGLSVLSMGYPHCNICGLVLDPNERECPRCEQASVRDERMGYRGVQ